MTEWDALREWARSCVASGFRPSAKERAAFRDGYRAGNASDQLRQYRWLVRHAYVALNRVKTWTS
jgi:hypothetical protein